MASLGIAHFYAAAEHQKTNGLTEKDNATIVDRITAHMVDDVSLWDRQLGAAVFARNTSVQTSICCGYAIYLYLYVMCSTLSSPRANVRR